MVHRLLSRTWPSFAKCITKTVGNAVEKIFRRIELISEADINAMIDADTDTNVKSATAQDDDIEAVDLFVAVIYPVTTASISYKYLMQVCARQRNCVTTSERISVYRGACTQPWIALPSNPSSLVLDSWQASPRLGLI